MGYDGIALNIVLHCLPIRSPRAVAFVPPSDEPDPKQQRKDKKKRRRKG